MYVLNNYILTDEFCVPNSYIASAESQITFSNKYNTSNTFFISRTSSLHDRAHLYLFQHTLFLCPVLIFSMNIFNKHSSMICLHKESRPLQIVVLYNHAYTHYELPPEISPANSNKEVCPSKYYNYELCAVECLISRRHDYDKP